MRLIWFIYSNHNDIRRKKYKRKYILGIVLGDVYGKLHILETSKLTDGDVLLIRTYIDELLPLKPQQRMTWLRERIPMSFRKAYKTIYKDRIEIMDQFEISGLGEVQ